MNCRFVFFLSFILIFVNGFGQERYNDSQPYALDTLQVFDQQVIVKGDLWVVSGNPALDKDEAVMEKNFYVSAIQHDRHAEIIFQSVISTDLYKIYIRRDTAGRLYVYKEFSYASAVSQPVEIAPDDYNQYRCTRICSHDVNKPIEGIITLDDYFGEERSTECFDCPVRYTIEECLDMKSKNQQFIWEEN